MVVLDELDGNDVVEVVALVSLLVVMISKPENVVRAGLIYMSSGPLAQLRIGASIRTSTSPAMAIVRGSRTGARTFFSPVQSISAV
jgi:hypothetical protein